MAAALEECNLHRRIGLGTLRLFGTSPRVLTFAFMFPTALLSVIKTANNRAPNINEAF